MKPFLANYFVFHITRTCICVAEKDINNFVLLNSLYIGKGPASLSWDERTYKCANIYLQKLRPTVANAQSYLKRSNQTVMESLFFLTTNGNHMHSSQLSNRLTKVAKLFDSSIKGTVTGKRIRKSAVSRHRELLDSGNSSGLSKDELARQMSHSTSTADGHYAMRDHIKGNVYYPFHVRLCRSCSLQK